MSGYRGCMASLLKHKVVVDLQNPRFQDADVREAGTVVSGCQPWEACILRNCRNGCGCTTKKAECDNSMWPFTGQFCEKRDTTLQFYTDQEPGHVWFRYDDDGPSTMDKISFGFKACEPNGLFAKLSGRNENEQIKLYLENGNVVAEYKLGGPQAGKIVVNGEYTSKWYTVQFVRTGLEATLGVFESDGELIEKESTVLSGSNSQLDGLRLLEIGSVRNEGKYEDAFKGFISGFKHRGYRVFNLVVGKASDRTYLKTPGTLPIDKDTQEFNCPAPVSCGPLKQICENFGVCQNDVCNCTLTGYRGERCNKYPVGHYYGFNNFEPGLDIHVYPRPVTTFEDYFAVGIMTYETEGTIFRVENEDQSQYYHFSITNGTVRFDYKLKDTEDFMEVNKFTVDSYDDVYFIIRMNRTKDKISFVVTQNMTKLAESRTKTVSKLAQVPFRNQYRIMAGGLVQRTSLDKITSDWNGILGGLYYNGLFMYDLEIDNFRSNQSGDVAIAPIPYTLKPEPPPDCSKCYNFGTRLASKQCDCIYTSYTGLCCNSRDDLYGFQLKKHDANGVVIYNSSIAGGMVDDLAVSFRTARGWGDGHIMKVQSKDGAQYILVEIRDDKLLVTYMVGDRMVRRTFNDDIREKEDHRVRLHRNGNTGYIQLDNTRINVQFVNGKEFNPSVIFVGGGYNGTYVTSGHYGIIWNAVYNGVDVVKQTISGSPGIVAKENEEGNFNVVGYPWPPLCDKGTITADADCSTPTSAPGGAGAVIIGMGSGGKQVPVINPAPAGTAPPGSTAIIAAIMGGLLFASAIAFAAAGMKPGFLAIPKKVAGGAYAPVPDTKTGGFPVANGNNYVVAVGMDEYNSGAGGGSQTGSKYEDSYTQESRFDYTDTGAAAAAAGAGGYNTYNQSSSWYARNETLENQDQVMYGAGSTIGGYGGKGYAGSTAGGSVAGSVYGFGTVTNPDQAFITLSEDIAVDNVVLTADGRYVVTGSNLGPPQVWNTTVSGLLYNLYL